MRVPMEHSFSRRSCDLEELDTAILDKAVAVKVNF